MDREEKIHGFPYAGGDAPAPHAMRPAPPGLTVLFVEDDPDMADLIREILEDDGMETIWAQDGARALEILRDATPDVVLVDMVLPGRIDGAAVCRIMKSDPRLEPIPVLAASARKETEDILQGFECGADEYMVKPFQNRELVARVRALARLGRTRRDLARQTKLLNVLLETAEVCGRSLDRAGMTQSVIETVLEKVGFDAGWIVRFAPGGSLDLLQRSGLRESFCNDPFIQNLTRQCLTGKIQTADRDAIEEAALNLRGLRDPDGGDVRSIETILAVPLKTQAGIIGVMGLIGLRRPRRDFPDEAFFVSLANPIAMSVENSRLYAKALEARQNYKTMHEEAAALNQRLKDAMRKLQNAQARLVQTEKLTSIASLVSGLAHEMNNPLTGVMGYAQLLLAREDLLPEVVLDVARIEREAQRCHQIVQNLLAFARGREERRVLFSLSEAVENVLALHARRLQTENITVERGFDAGLPPVLGDPFQIKQALMCLIDNAVLAVKETGRGFGRLEVRGRTEGDFLLLDFRDDGQGIDPKNFHRIFDPFFTTRDVGKGTGLGLSLTYGILKDHGGNVYVESSPGEGTAFTVELPLSREEGSVAGAVLKKDGALAGTRVLFCGTPEEATRRFGDALKREGASCTEAVNLEKAYIALNDERHDAVVCSDRFENGNLDLLYLKLGKSHPLLTNRMLALAPDQADARDLEKYFSKNIEAIPESASPETFLQALRKILSEESEGEGTGDAFNPEGRVILAVDDEPSVRKVIQAILKDEGYRVITANGGEEALDIARRERIDLILLDIMMPGMDGFETCRRLRMDDATERIPIFMLTARTSLEDKVASFQMGASRYISKPFNPLELIQELNRYFQGAASSGGASFVP